jgi:hypothetical protein
MRRHDVAVWPLTDMAALANEVRYQGKSRHPLKQREYLLISGSSSLRVNRRFKVRV